MATGCVSEPPRPAPEPAAQPPALPDTSASELPSIAEPVQGSEPLPAPDAARASSRVSTVYSALFSAQWEDLPGWKSDELREAWRPFLATCVALKSRLEWQDACRAAAEVTAHDTTSLRAFFETRFRPWLVRNEDGTDRGMVTGYYEPLLYGSRAKTPKYRYPLYGVPADLVAVEIAELYPGLKGQRVRGRLEGRRLVPYYTRGEIENGRAGLQGRELLWIDDPVALFFLHIQGSGRVRLESGEVVRVGYADHNGHPYRSIGRVLIERGELSPDKASMQGIQGWARTNPDKLAQLLAENPAYVFFRELPADVTGPIGSLGVPLAAKRSIAVDPAFIPLGAPVYLATTWPNSQNPLALLVLAQDTGAAIKGRVRADYFWGFGPEAGQLAGRMRQQGRMWVLLPKDFALLPR